MKSIMRLFIAFALTIFAFSVSAEDFPKPNNTEIEKLLKINLQGGNIPTTWVGFIAGSTSNAIINQTEVMEWGIFNNREQYWPAKIRVAGSAEFLAGLGGGQVKQFNVLAEFRFYKDDYGKLKAYTLDFGGWQIIPDRNVSNYTPKSEAPKSRSECLASTAEECMSQKIAGECAKSTDSTSNLGPCMSQHGYSWNGFKWVKQ